MSGAVHEPEVMESEVPAALSLAGGGDIDAQVSTARRFPRSITKFQQKALEMATLNVEIATSCIYALPRKDENGRQKNIEGPSARFAEIMASAWGNLRAEGKTVGDDGQYVTGRGMAWDVENNVAIAFEVKRRITNREGRTYNADMIMVTGNAGASIALRNAILKVVPTAFWKPIYNECRRTVAGDVKTFASRRDVMLKEFAVMGVTEERLFGAFGLKGKEDITLEHIATLRGFYTALKDGDTTIEETFPEAGGVQGAPKPAQRKSEQQNGETGSQQREARSREMPSAETGAVGGSTPQTGSVASPSVAAPAQPTAPAAGALDGATGKVADVQPLPGGGWIIALEGGFKCGTRSQELADAASAHKAAGTVIEVAARPARRQGAAPMLEWIDVVPAREPGSDDE